MHAPRPGYFWKVPFFWEPGSPVPAPEAGVHFEPASREWLSGALADVMASSPDESDQAAVAERGAAGAAEELLDIDRDFFEYEPTWWVSARDAAGSLVGFVLPVLLKPETYWRENRRTGSIYYMGVLPAHRGKGYGAALLAQATRTFIEAHCWRIFCDTSARNEPMLAAFRSAGYLEREPWERPVR